MQKKYSFYIAGLKFHRYEEVKDLIEVGDNLHLETEPTNTFDPFAVKIYYELNDQMFLLGHVPMKMKQSEKVSRALDALETYEAVVTKHFQEAPPYERLKVEITFNG